MSDQCPTCGGRLHFYIDTCGIDELTGKLVCDTCIRNTKIRELTDERDQLAAELAVAEDQLTDFRQACVDNMDDYSIKTCTPAAVDAMREQLTAVCAEVERINELALQTSERLVNAWEWGALWKRLAKRLKAEAVFYREGMAETNLLLEKAEDAIASLKGDLKNREYYDVHEDSLAWLQSVYETKANEYEEAGHPSWKYLSDACSDLTQRAGQIRQLRALVKDLVEGLEHYGRHDGSWVCRERGCGVKIPCGLDSLLSRARSVLESES